MLFYAKEWQERFLYNRKDCDDVTEYFESYHANSSL
jgi:hypothetical protein